MLQYISFSTSEFFWEPTNVKGLHLKKTHTHKEAACTRVKGDGPNCNENSVLCEVIIV